MTDRPIEAATRLTNEQALALVRRATDHDSEDADEDWGSDSLNMQWFSSIALPIVRAVESALLASAPIEAAQTSARMLAAQDVEAMLERLRIEPIPPTGPDAGPNKWSVRVGDVWVNAPTISTLLNMLGEPRLLTEDEAKDCLEWTLLATEVEAIQRKFCEVNNIRLASAPPAEARCATCGANEPFTGSCGTSDSDTKALCKRGAPPAATEPMDLADMNEMDAKHPGWDAPAAATAPQQCQHHYVMDDEHPTHECCQKCGQVRRTE